MTSKKVGIFIFIVCIALALGLVFLRKVRITKKEKPSTSVSQQTETPNKQVEVEEPPAMTESPATTQAPQTEPVQQEESPTEAQVPVPQPDENSVVLDKIVAEDKLSYAGADQTTMGYVKAKNCYLQGTQIIYCVDIDVTMGTVGQVIQYYCTYLTYDSIQVGEVLSVTYKQTTTNTFAVMYVQRAGEQ